jgi:hypothetical protein
MAQANSGGGRFKPLRRHARWPRVLLFVLVASATAGLFRQGLVAPIFNPLPLIDLAQPTQRLIDWRLASIKNYPGVCLRTLKAPHIEAQPIPDNPLKNGCGWHNSVRLASAGGVRAGFDKLTCETAVALALWLEHEVQPLAGAILGQQVRSIQSFGGYSCRNIVGNAAWRDVRSQHAIANAADIGGFTLADGRSIGVRAHWRGDGPEGRFLRAVHRRACVYFRVALSPNYNAAHHDHFHLDRGTFSRCK